MDRILSATEPAIRAILVAICDDDPLRARCLTYLDQLERHNAAAGAPGAPVGSPTSSDPNGSAPGSLGKRKASATPQICIQCKSAFNPDANPPGACLYHHGKLVFQPSAEVWAGWDDALFGDKDAPGNREAYPQGFEWSCCKNNGTRPGCRRGAHVAIRGENKRLRLPGPGQDPDVMRMFEGRVLRPNEFVNENLWAGDWDDPAAIGWAPAGFLSNDDDDDDDDDDVGGSDAVRADVSEQTELDSGGGSDLIG